MKTKKNSTPQSPFIDLLYNIKDSTRSSLIAKFTAKRRVNKFCKMINECSPDFDMLWQMANFIKYAEGIFFYDNSIKNYLYSSRNYQDGQNGFKITTEECVITIKLFQDSDRVCLDIDRVRGEKMKTSFTFSNSQWLVEFNRCDEMLLDQVIKIINGSIIRLVRWCYSKK